ncbi:DUF4873 domain-containing protein [Rhodococcus sp. NPDC003322]
MLEPDTAYDGPAVLATGTAALDVVVHLGGHFEPLDGHFHWYGRVDGPDLAGLSGRDRARLTLTIDAGQPRPAVLGEQDPWGHLRISGTGAPPYPLDEVELDVPIP